MNTQQNGEGELLRGAEGSEVGLSADRVERAGVAAHTPGPWRVERSVRLGDTVAMLGQNMEGEVWLVCASDRVPDAHLPGNARLIAAAPDLLVALKAFDALGLAEFPNGPDDPGISFLEPDLSVWRQARAAIAKATA